MAYAPFKLSTLETMLSNLQKATASLTESVAFMKEHGMKDAMLKGESRTAYAESLLTFATHAALHIPNQHECSLNGETPMWQSAKTKSTIDMNREKAKQIAESQGLIKPADSPPANQGKKGTKKKPPTEKGAK